jgi:hypothetical protein
MKHRHRVEAIALISADGATLLRRITSSLVFIAATLAVEAHSANVVTHYDAGTLPLAVDGSTVPQLVDISGNNNHATGSGGTYLSSGIGGLPSVRFTPNNLDDGYHSTFSMGSQFGIRGDAGWPIVEYRPPTGRPDKGPSYRVRTDLFEKWGGLSTEAERYFLMRGWEWANDETGLGLFDRLHQAVMLLDSLLNPGVIQNDPLVERAMFMRAPAVLAR